ncbi:hypothetical protein, partial [Burkholderia sp.]|uniref:hypothetical protein n=1 Tax=Burkholderia sp. TaxID=36773 RepID=UPI002586E04F
MSFMSLRAGEGASRRTWSEHAGSLSMDCPSIDVLSCDVAHAGAAAPGLSPTAKGLFTSRNARGIPVVSPFRRLKTCFASQNRFAISLKNKRNLYLMSYIR